MEQALLVNALGLAGSASAMVMLAPGAVAVWRNRRDEHALRGVSLWQPAAVIANSVIWIAYALLTRAWWSGAMSLVHIPLSVATLAWVLRARAGASREAREAMEPEPVTAERAHGRTGLLTLRGYTPPGQQS